MTWDTYQERAGVKPGKQVLMILGMHRSGTSASTGALQCVGVNLGPRLYKGHQGINDKGYFEHEDIADTNDEVLLAMGSSWDDVLLRKEDWWKSDRLFPYARKLTEVIQRDFSQSTLWAVKDPRVCRLLPWWLDILSAEGVSPHFLFVVRSPEAVHRSLAHRDGFSREKAHWLWTLHYLEAERASRGHPRAFVDFDRFLENPVDALRTIETTLNLRYPISVNRAQACLERFLAKDLRHHQGDPDETNGFPIVELAREAHGLLLSAAEGASEDRAFDRLWERVVSLQDTFQSVLVEQIRALETRRGELQIFTLKALRSWSWWAGKPVRYLERRMGRDV